MWGAFLGPLLFVIFMNYLPLKMNSGLVYLLMTTTAIVRENLCTQLKELVAETLLELGGWFAANGIKLNKN